MTCFLGLDLGTSSLKAVIVDERQIVLATAEVKLATSHPAPLASEQDAGAWWGATCQALDRLAAEAAPAMARVAAIGLSGQMHALVLLDAADTPIRPAMLWNDGRAHGEADALKRLGDELSAALGVPAMAGFTASKLLWLGRHEPAVLARARSLLLPKDLIRLRLTGERVTDLSDAAGTWLLDQARRQWSQVALDAVGLDRSVLPSLTEGTSPTGTVRPDLASRFGLKAGVVVAGGGGDTPCGGVGIGAVNDGHAYVSLGTSAQVFVAAAAHRPAPARMVHSFCHAIPDRWYQMAALMNGASVLGFFASLLGREDVGALTSAAAERFIGPSRLLVLPYLTGERTPHDDPYARGVVFGLSADSTREDLMQAAIEGVAFSFADGRDALDSAGTRITHAGFIGGGARNPLAARIIASVLDIPLHLYADSARGSAFGAARLARLALGQGDPASILAAPATTEIVAPERAMVEAYRPRLDAFRQLYRALRPEFARAAATWIQ